MTEFKTMERANYYNGQLLDASLFDLEQDYCSRLMNYHNQALFSPGVVCGLEVSITDDQQISVSQGLAIDGQGRQLVWPCNGPTTTLPNNRGESVNVYIQWHEKVGERGCGQEPSRSVVSLLPRINFSNGENHAALRIAVITFNGDLPLLDNRKTKTRLTVAAQPAQPHHGAGCTTFKLNFTPHQVLCKTVYFNANKKPAFRQIPIVTITPVSQQGRVYALSLSVVTPAAFQVHIVWIAGCLDRAGTEDQVGINWQALPTSKQRRLP